MLSATLEMAARSRDLPFLELEVELAKLACRRVGSGRTRSAAAPGRDVPSERGRPRGATRTAGSDLVRRVLEAVASLRFESRQSW
jgi:hypothetical protein